MALDLVMLKHVLEAMATGIGRPWTIEALVTDVEVRTNRALHVQQVEAALGYARDQGWAAVRVDKFQRDVWTITEAGLSARREL